MFGLWRLILAFEVVINHLFLIPILGPFAVVSFFTLSAFLMTMIMQKTYGYSAKGFGAFALNRVLRLHPNFWYAGLVSVICILVFGEATMSSLNVAFTMPANGWEWFQNVSMIYADPNPISVIPRLSPPTWALTVELLFYALIGLGLSGDKRLTWLWFLASFAYNGAAYLLNWGMLSVYGSLIGGSLPFAVGAMTYHYKDYLTAQLTRWKWTLPSLVLLRWAIMFAVLVFTILYGRDWWRVREVFNGLNAFMSAGIIICLLNLKLAPKWKKLDTRLGDFCYPVYLLHWQAAAIASIVLFGRGVKGPHLEGLMNFGPAMAVLFLLCCVSVYGIDPAVSKIRDKVRAKADAKGAADIVRQAGAP